MLEMFTDADPMRSADFRLPADGWLANNSGARRAQEGMVDIESEFNEIAGRAKVGATRLWSSEEKAICWAQDEIALLRTQLAAMESQASPADKPAAYKIDDGTTSGYVFTDHQKIVQLEELYGVKSTPLVECKPARITEQDAREISESCLAHWLYKRPEEFHVGEWLATRGRTLLNKLNADREQVPAVAVPEKTYFALADELFELAGDAPAGEAPNLSEIYAILDKHLVATPSHRQQSGESIPTNSADGAIALLQGAQARNGIGGYAENLQPAINLLMRARRPSHESEQGASE